MLMMLALRRIHPIPGSNCYPAVGSTPEMIRFQADADDARTAVRRIRPIKKFQMLPCCGFGGQETGELVWKDFQLMLMMLALWRVESVQCQVPTATLLWVQRRGIRRVSLTTFPADADDARLAVVESIQQHPAVGSEARKRESQCEKVSS